MFLPRLLPSVQILPRRAALLATACAGVAAALLPAALDAAGYRLLSVPPKWQFKEPTPAYSPQTGEKLGDFQAGIQVDVLSIDPAADKWLVRYNRYDQPPLDSHIDWPGMDRGFPERWEPIRRELENAPLIDKVLSGQSPWNESLVEMAKTYLSGKLILEAGSVEAPQRIVSKDSQIGVSWGLQPVFIAVESSPSGLPALLIEFWNKADGRQAQTSFPSNSVNNAYHLLNQKLATLSQQFGSNYLPPQEDGDNTLSLVREQRNIYPLANRTQALLRYQRNEYLILELRPFLPPPPPWDRSAQGNAPGSAVAVGTAATQAATSAAGNQSLSERLRQNITVHKDGHRYLSGIPMISQGDKGYCAAATLARVLQYYGYQVDMYQMATLASTDNYGTSYRDIVNAIRRICNTTPYRFRTIRTRDRKELAEQSIERGMPLIWLVPGHARLLIGINPDTGQVVYTDSWGPGHDFKTMRWDEAMRMTHDLFLLDVGN